MFRRGLICCVFAVIIGFSMAQSTYTLYTKATAATNTSPSKVELITTTGTSPDVINVQVKWTFGTATATAAAASDRAVVICCVDSLLSSTDPLAAFLKDKCFGAHFIVSAAAAAAGGNTKAVFVQGVKTGTNFAIGSYINPTGNVGEAVTLSTNDILSPTWGINAGEQAAIGLLTTAATTINYKCGVKDLAAAATAGDLAGTAVVAIDQTATGTFSVVGSGTTSCKTTTSSSSATFEGIVPMAFFASILAFLALF